MKFFQLISVLSVFRLIGVLSLSVQLEEIQLPPAPSRAGAIVVLEQMRGSLENWGTKDVPQSVVEPGEQTLGVQSLRLAKLLSYHRVMMCSMMLLLVAMAILLTPCTCWQGDADHHISECSTDAPVDLAVAVQSGSGSWVRTYQCSSGEQKDALELLYRCKIVSVQEFTESSASQEHIDECVWIAAQMLGQKPLEEWVARRQQALQSFEDSITAVFAARTMAGYASRKSSKQSLPPENNCTMAEDFSATALEGALKDLLMLKRGFPAPATRVPSNASTVQASPVTPGRLPALLADRSRGAPLNSQDGEITVGSLVRALSDPCVLGAKRDALHG